MANKKKKQNDKFDNETSIPYNNEETCLTHNTNNGLEKIKTKNNHDKKEIEKEEKDNNLIIKNEQFQENDSFLEDTLSIIVSNIQILQDGFNTKIKYDLHKDEIIDNMHSELQKYKNDIILKSVNPIINDLIGLYDDFESSIIFYKGKKNSESIIIILKDFQLTVFDILEKHDVFAFKSLNTSFDSKLQQAMKIIETNDSKKNLTIKKHIRIGFKRYDKVIRPERVEVFKYRQTEKKKANISDEMGNDTNK